MRIVFQLCRAIELKRNLTWKKNHPDDDTQPKTTIAKIWKRKRKFLDTKVGSAAVVDPLTVKLMVTRSHPAPNFHKKIEEIWNEISLEPIKISTRFYFKWLIKFYDTNHERYFLCQKVITRNLSISFWDWLCELANGLHGFRKILQWECITYITFCKFALWPKI